jgi:excisionase family DNA binding protein
MIKEQSKNNEVKSILNNEIKNPVWLSVSEAAKIGGVQTKTIRRAIQYNNVKYKIIGNRYLIDLSSLVTFLHTKTKLKNKLNQFGLGQYVDKWKT